MNKTSGSDLHDVELDAILSELSELRHRYGFFSFLRHRRLFETIDSVTDELKNVHALLTPPTFTAAAQEEQAQFPSRAKSKILASLSVLCRHLSEIASSAMRHRDSMGMAVRRLAEWLIQQLADIMKNAKQILGFMNWNLSISAGFPSGISYSITIDFQ